MKNVLYGVIAFVILVAGGVFVWSKIQDEKVKQATIELKQKVQADKEKAEKEKVVKEQAKIENAQSYKETIEKYRVALTKDYMKSTELNGDIDKKTEDFNKQTKHEQLEKILIDANNIIAMKNVPLQYQSQHNKFIDIANNVKGYTIDAETKLDEGGVMDSVQVLINPDNSFLTDTIDMMKMIEKLPSPVQ